MWLVADAVQNLLTRAAHVRIDVAEVGQHPVVDFLVELGEARVGLLVVEYRGGVVACSSEEQLLDLRRANGVPLLVARGTDLGHVAVVAGSRSACGVLVAYSLSVAATVRSTTRLTTLPPHEQKEDDRKRNGQ